MPKHNKKKLKSDKQQLQQHNNNYDSTDDNVSTISSAATSILYQNDLIDSPTLDFYSNKQGGGDQHANNNDNIQNEIETKLDTSLEGIQEKGFKEREDSLKQLIDLFKKYYLNEYLLNKEFTLTELLHRCLKRGKSNEQQLALQAIQLVFIQFGYSTQSDEFLSNIKETLLTFIKNENSKDVSASCIRVLSIAIYITNNIDAIVDFMNTLETIMFIQNVDKLQNNAINKSITLAAVSAWSLLLTIIPINYVNNTLLDKLTRFEYLLENLYDVDIRVNVGESIALLYEICSNRHDLNSNLSSFNSDNLIEIITNLIKESTKSTSKKDKRHQHQVFRDILKLIEDYNQTIENGQTNNGLVDYEYDDDINMDSSSIEVIKFSNQELFLENWQRKKQYRSFSDVLGTGMNTHLEINETIRDIFELGPRVFNNNHNQHANNYTNKKLSKMQRVNKNKEEFRYRTKDLNRKRETKFSVENQFKNDDLDL